MIADSRGACYTLAKSSEPSARRSALALEQGVKLGRKLVVVESPAKAKTIRHILGQEYRVVASMGHVRDLPRKEMGIDIERGFRPRYTVISRRKKAVQQLQKAAGSADVLYLATDLDREGEAIAWHVLQLLRRRLPKNAPVHRITFHEITRQAITAAFQHAGRLNQALVDAQQTRRILDRLVGYSISPLLWKRVRGVRRKATALSAGRVQTVALRLVVDREREIEAFVPVEYWSIEALLAQQIAEPIPFLAQLWRILGTDGQPHEPDLKSETDAKTIVKVLEDALYWVERVEQERKPRYPWPPFTTSTMQQAASKTLRFSPRQTMQVAQQLYEGLPLGEEGTVGLITYMRTDSTYVAPEAQAASRQVIARYWGEQYLPARPPTYRTKVRSAQEAHEAIRPTDPHRTPRQVRPYLDQNQARLYELIWRRFIASQMKPALYDVTTAIIPTARADRNQRLPYLFRAQGRICVFDGFLKVYQEKAETTSSTQDDEPDQDQGLPALEAGEGLDLLELLPKQHWTKPPPRYTESSLIKELERRGVGRPSTYAGMVSLIQDRAYVSRDGRALVPTELGLVVCDLLVSAFPDLFDYDFTAELEEQLDEIANRQAQYTETLEAFWQGLSRALADAEVRMPSVQVKGEQPEPTGRACPKCGAELVKRKGRYGYFVGCSSYPKCKYVERRKPKTTGIQCPLCGQDLVIRRGRHGPFVGCSGYPDCTYTVKVGADQTRPETAKHQT